MAAPRPNASSSEEQPSADKQVYCWACRALIVVPVQDGRHVQIFKCGWCGAINPQHHTPHPGYAASDARSTAPKAEGTWTAFLDRMEDRVASACSDSAFTAIGAIVVVFVCAIVTGIGVFGIYPVLWDFCDSTLAFALHVCVAACLLGNIYFNYALAVSRSPGRVSEFYDLSRHPPERNSLNDFTYCHKCEKPKPPNAHHCSVCGFCIVDMDHHCPFLNNCVGRGNMRHFLLFLFWVTVAMFYSLTMLALSLVHNKREIQRAVRASKARAPRVSSFLREPSLALNVLLRLPPAPFVAMFLTILCTIVLAMVGSLCVRAWKYALDGSTYVGALKGEKLSSGGWYDNLRYVFGTGHPLYWFLPSWRRPQDCQKLTKGA